MYLLKYFNMPQTVANFIVSLKCDKPYVRLLFTYHWNGYVKVLSLVMCNLIDVYQCFRGN
jgi:hypothetical protein